MNKIFLFFTVVILAANIVSLTVFAENEVKPIIVETNLTGFKIGYCSYEASPLTIKETYAGELKKDTEIQVALSGGFFINNFSETSIESDTLKISTNMVNETETKKITDNNGKEFEYNNYVSIIINEESTNTPSTITLSNIHPKIDRTSAVGTTMYILVFGTAIDTIFHDENSTEKLLALPYIEITNTSHDAIIISKDTPTVDMFINKDYYIVDGTKFYMDGKPYIDDASGHIMIPIKHALSALGMPDESIIWDENTRQVAILTEQRIIQYTVNSDIVLVNGSSMPIVADGEHRIMPIVKNGRVFIPFRSLGEVLDMPVRWNKSKQMVSLNTYME